MFALFLQCLASLCDKYQDLLEYFELSNTQPTITSRFFCFFSIIFCIFLWYVLWYLIDKYRETKIKTCQCTKSFFQSINNRHFKKQIKRHAAESWLFCLLFLCREAQVEFGYTIRTKTRFYINKSCGLFFFTFWQYCRLIVMSTTTVSLNVLI